MMSNLFFFTWQQLITVLRLHSQILAEAFSCLDSIFSETNNTNSNAHCFINTIRSESQRFNPFPAAYHVKVCSHHHLILKLCLQLAVLPYFSILLDWTTRVIYLSCNRKFSVGVNICS
jgi:hypothetical protein